MNDTLTITTKNKRTGQMEVIVQHECKVMDWGFRFFVEDELAAFKAAYQYRNSPHGVRVEFAGGSQGWMVTVFNETAKASGIDGTK